MHWTYLCSHIGSRSRAKACTLLGVSLVEFMDHSGAALARNMCLNAIPMPEPMSRHEDTHTDTPCIYIYTYNQGRRRRKKKRRRKARKASDPPSHVEVVAAYNFGMILRLAHPKQKQCNTAILSEVVSLLHSLCSCSAFCILRAVYIWSLLSFTARVMYFPVLGGSISPSKS